MASKSSVSYAERAKNSKNKLVQKLFEVAEQKKSNVVVSADLITTKELLHIADRESDGGISRRCVSPLITDIVLGPYIAVFKTHIDIVTDFDETTVSGLKKLSEKHNFLFFEDRKLVDIGNTVQMQYHGGALKISEWAHLVNASVLAGPAIIEALAKTASADNFPYKGDRGLLILAEMTTKGSLAIGDYTLSSVKAARENKDFVVGFVATRSLTSLAEQLGHEEEEDFVVFTTGVNRSSAGDKLGQQYQTPKQAVKNGADFIIAGRGIYAAPDPVEAVKLYRHEGWESYLERIGS